MISAPLSLLPSSLYIFILYKLFYLLIEIFNRIECEDKGKLKYWSSDIKFAKFLLLWKVKALVSKGRHEQRLNVEPGVDEGERGGRWPDGFKQKEIRLTIEGFHEL